MSDESRPDAPTIDRRTLLAGLSAGATMGLAGCGGGGQDATPAGGGGGGGGGPQETDVPDDERELGERVPRLTHNYFSGTAVYETYAELVSRDLSEHLSLRIDPKPRDTTSQVFGLYQDDRQSLLPSYTFGLEADPHFTTIRMMAHQAGNGIGAAAGQNVMQWANCDYSVRAEEQSRHFDRETRQRYINEAHSFVSYAAVLIPMAESVQTYGFRTDQIDPDRDAIEERAPYTTNPEAFVNIDSVGDNDVIYYATSGAYFEILNPYTFTWIGSWNNYLTHSPLLHLDPHFELENNLASSIEFEDDDTTVVVELKEDATFHNGDPVTAEDLKFTYDYIIAGSRGGTHTFTPSLPMLDEIAQVDDRTVAFDMNEPHAPLYDREFWVWGIQDKATWMEQLAEFGVDSFDTHEHSFDQYGEVEVPADEVNGSGPFVLSDFQSAQSVSMTPFDDHPTFETPGCDLELLNYRDPGSRLQALRAGELNVAPLSQQQATQVEDDPDVLIASTPEIQHLGFLAPNWAAPPTKFLEFRQAVAAAVDRREMAEIASLGAGDPETHAILYTEVHPWRPPNDMLYKMAPDPTGSPEMARAFLEEAGWGWDENDNLRYPADADLTVRWEKGGTPDPDDYPCLTSEGYTRPEGYEMTEDQVPGYTMDPSDPWPEGFGD